ncbi:MAG TPA: hypothetical protein VFH51_03170 [Myxococcota bacterium]|nr:hypothetical protein [Myxococcota bacterium]
MYNGNGRIPQGIPNVGYPVATGINNLTASGPTQYNHYGPHGMVINDRPFG